MTTTCLDCGQPANADLCPPCYYKRPEMQAAMSKMDWLEAVGQQAVEWDRNDAYVKIVREMAQRGPFLGGEDLDVCADCDVEEIPSEPDPSAPMRVDLNDPANHEPSCLWRRAKALYPGGTEAAGAGV